MIYGAYHTYQRAFQPLNLYAKAVGAIAGLDCFPFNKSYINRHVKAGAEFIERLTRRYENPGFQLDHTVINNKFVPVEERIIMSKPFYNLVHFKRAGKDNDPAGADGGPYGGPLCLADALYHRGIFTGPRSLYHRLEKRQGCAFGRR